MGYPSSTKRSLFTRTWVWLFVVSMGVPPLLMSLSWILPGAIAVIQTGICPPSAPDVPAYPCGLGEYLFRMTLGVWALMGHLVTWIAWFVANFIFWGLGLLGVGIYRSLRE